MKICVFHNSYRLQGGEDSVVRSEVDLLRQNGHDVLEIKAANQDISSLGYINAAISSTWSSKYYNIATNAISDFNPDIVHAHNYFPLISPSIFWASRQHNIPTVFTLHNFRLACIGAQLFRDDKICTFCLGKSPFFGVRHRCYRSSYLQSLLLATSNFVHSKLGTFKHKINAYIALNNFCKNIFIQHGLPEHKLHVKPNFILDPSITVGTKIPRGIYVGRFSTEKGILPLIRSLKALNISNFLFVGDGPLLEHIRSAGFEAFPWLPQSKVLQLISESMFLVIPSLWFECYPRTLVEAFACSVPVVAPNHGSFPELIIDGDNGILFNPNDMSSLTIALAFCYSNCDSLAEMGLLARKHYEMLLRPEINYQTMMSIYAAAQSSQ